jgi:hypothetical protein
MSAAAFSSQPLPAALPEYDQPRHPGVRPARGAEPVHDLARKFWNHAADWPPCVLQPSDAIALSSAVAWSAPRVRLRPPPRDQAKTPYP